METQSPQPSFEGAATVDQAAQALSGLLEQRRKKPDAQPEIKPAAAEKKPAAPAADEAKDETDTAAEQPGDTPADAKPVEGEPDADKGEADKPATEEIVVELDGEKLTPAQLREWKKERMLHADYSRKTREIAETRKAFEAERGQASQAIQAQLQEVGFLSNALLQQLTNAEQNTDWEALRATDPAKYAAAYADMHRKREVLQRSFAAYKQAEGAKQQQSQVVTQRTLAEQAQRLPELIPDWHDEKIAQTEKRQLAEYLAKDGLLSADELAGVSDARFVALARKAMFYDRAQAQRKEIAKKVEKSVPKLQKGGVASGDSKDHEIKQLGERLARTGRVDDMAKLLETKFKRQ